jgi:hypothetical protein
VGATQETAAADGTEPVRRWLLAHPRLHLHFTPTGSSWLNLVERWFAELTCKKLQRSVHRSVPALERDIRAWIKDWNANPRPYVWHKTADQILTSLASYCRRINGPGHLGLAPRPRFTTRSGAFVARVRW